MKILGLFILIALTVWLIGSYAHAAGRRHGETLDQCLDRMIATYGNDEHEWECVDGDDA